MDASREDIETLFEIQRIDMEVLSIKKTRASLPQRIQVVKVCKRREEILPKLEQVKALLASTQDKATKIEDEDRSLAQKQERAQEIINASGSDYRKVESHSRDMAGVAKRRASLEEDLSKINAELDKIRTVCTQLEEAVAACNSEEERLKNSYKAEDEALVSEARDKLSKRAAMAAKIDAALMSEYDRIAAKLGGVAIGKLEQPGSCSVCRSGITGGRLIELQAKAPIGYCPNCNRLLVIE